MSESTPDDGTPDRARAKRAPPTLDLSATEIPNADAAAAGTAKDAGSQNSRRPSRVLIPALSGAVAGALVAGAIFLAQSRMGSDRAHTPQANAAAINDIRTRLATLEGRPAPQPAAPADLSDITKRLDALDQGTAALREENKGLRAQAAQAIASANEAKTAADQAKSAAVPAPAAAPTDLGPIDARLTQLEAALRAQTEKAAEPSRPPADSAPLRRAVIATQLDALVRQGEPYAAALAAAKSLASDPAALKPLDAFATTGVPTAAKLSADFLALPQIAPAPDTATSSGLLERMRAGAAKLVRIERTDARAGDNAALHRATAAARRNDIATTVRELNTLSANDRVPVQPWLDRAAAADAARAAARQFADQSLAAAAKPGP